MQLDKLVTAKGSERSALLLEFLAESLPGVSVTVDPKICEKLAVPKQWQEFLLAQSNSVPIPWDLIWKPAENWFSKVRQLVVRKCCGVAVMLDGDLSPALIYVFYSNEGFGYSYFGNPPLQGANIAEFKNLKLPTAYKDFYSMVHNGFKEFHSLSGLMGYPRYSMEHIVSEEDAFDGESPPYRFINLVPIYSAAGGDFICIDVKRSSTLDVIGGRYKHEEPIDSVFDEDVKELVNCEFDYLLDQTADRQD
jgi:hypothetical protein